MQISRKYCGSSCKLLQPSKKVKTEKPTKKTCQQCSNLSRIYFTKKLEGRALKANEFITELKMATNICDCICNDANSNFNSPVDYTNKLVKGYCLKYKKGQEGTYTYTVTGLRDRHAITTTQWLQVVTVTISHDEQLLPITNGEAEPADKEFNNKVTPRKNLSSNQRNTLVSKAKFDITGTKLVVMTILNWRINMVKQIQPQ